MSSAAAGGSSYAQILRSSSIIGGATGINSIIGLVRTKVVAVLVGLSTLALISTVRFFKRGARSQSGRARNKLHHPFRKPTCINCRKPLDCIT